jgi:hypothetical protein
LRLTDDGASDFAEEVAMGYDRDSRPVDLGLTFLDDVVGAATIKHLATCSMGAPGRPAPVAIEDTVQIGQTPAVLTAPATSAPSFGDVDRQAAATGSHR